MEEKNMVTEIFSSMVFDDTTMEARLPKQTYKTLQKTIKDGKHTVIQFRRKDFKE